MNTVAMIYAIMLPWSNQQKATNVNKFHKCLGFFTVYQTVIWKKHYGPNSTPLEVKDHLDLTKDILSGRGN